MRRPAPPPGARASIAAALLFGAAIAAVPPLALLWRSWQARVAVEGHSMEPTLHDGDWLLVDADAYRCYSPRAGELVLAADPRESRRLIVKRVRRIEPDGSLVLVGDHPAHKEEAGLPPVPRSALRGRPWLRYWPLRRFGRIR
jgi:signal peptidase I